MKQSVSGFLNQIIDAAGIPDSPTADQVECNQAKRSPILCLLCRCLGPGDSKYCPDCQKTIDRSYQISMLSGRCRTGSDASGSVWHARLLNDDNQVNHVAICGRKPQGLSGGWSSWHPDSREVTCPKCLKKMVKWVRG